MFLKIQSQQLEIIFFIVFPLIFCYLVVILIKKLANKLSISEKPNYRKFHENPIPNLGGIAIFISFLLSIIYLRNYTDLYLENFNIILFSSFGIVLIGLLDDLYNLSPFIRLMAHFFITSFIWSKGLTIGNLSLEYFNLGISPVKIPDILSLLITFLWVGGIINAINWIDGLNGLASLISILILVGIAKIAAIKSLFGLLYISLILIGSILGFLIHNLKPNNIIMGDNGSNFLGFQLSILCLYAGSTNQNIIYSSGLEIFPLIPFLLIGFPILDMVRVIFKRIKLNKSPFFPDRNHFHHILLDHNFSHKEVLFLILSIAFYLISCSFLFTEILNKIETFFIANMLIIINLIILRKKFLKIFRK